VDEELPHFAFAREDFKKIGVAVVVSDFETISAFRSKLKAFEAFSKAGVGTPFTSRNAFEIKGKVVAKPEKGRGASGIRAFESPTEAAAFASKAAVPYVFQEFAEGKEFTVDVLCDFDGNAITAAVRERLLTESGIAVKSRIVKEPRIWKDAVKITKARQFRGPINVQCRKSADGKIRFFDLNPRYAGTVALSIAAGAPMVSALVKMLRGEKVKPTGQVYKDLYMFRYWREEFVLGKLLIKNGFKK
jgi:carbamoyl-phosphate synthase large subunit